MSDQVYFQFDDCGRWRFGSGWFDSYADALAEFLDDGMERCIACDVAFREGDEVFADYSGGEIHAACCGPERESYVGHDGEPLKDGEPIPTPYKWKPISEEGDEA